MQFRVQELNQIDTPQSLPRINYLEEEAKYF